MPVIEEQVSIGAPIEAVFDRLADPRRGPEWTPNLLSAEPLTPGPPAPGLETRLVVSMAGRRTGGVGRCLELERPTRLVLSSRLDLGVSSVTTFGLRASADGTLLSARVDFTVAGQGLGRLVGGLFGETLARRDLRSALANLKAQLEREARG